MFRKSLLTLMVTGIAAVGDAGVASAVGVGQTCGTIAGIACDDKLWCDPDPGQCAVADFSGKCVVIPEICTKEYIPVCGCNDKTYGNNCERLAAKVGKRSDGECKGAYKQ